MTTDEAVKKRSKAHQRYVTESGEPCVGVTTVLGKIAKPQLVKWANKLGLEGHDVTKYVDALARIGTLAHYLIECDCKKVAPELADYTANELESAKKSFEKWLTWKAQNNFEVISNELQLVDSKLKFGGTVDIIGKVNGKVYVIDIKTCKAIY